MLRFFTASRLALTSNHIFEIGSNIKNSIMKITESVKDNVSQVYLEGRFDAHTSDTVDAYIREKMEQGRHQFVLNMEKVPFIDSAGLRVILVIARDLRGEYQGDLHVTMLQPAVNKVFEISGLNNVMRIFDDAKTAVQSFSE
jgi:anti-anti-sigma factor